MGRQRLGDLPGGHAQGPGPGHGVVGGVVPVGGVPGNLHRALQRGPLGEDAPLHRRGAGGPHQGVDLPLGLFDQVHVCNPFSLTSIRNRLRLRKFF